MEINLMYYYVYKQTRFVDDLLQKLLLLLNNKIKITTTRNCIIKVIINHILYLL